MLSNNTQVQLLGQLTDTDLAAGRRGLLPMQKGARTLALDVTVTGDLVVGTNPASAVVDTGSILSAFDECGISDGSDRLPTNPLDCAFITQAMSSQATQATRLAALAVGTHSLKERFTLYGSLPYARSREDVTFMEKNLSGDLRFYIRQSNADGVHGASRIATAGAGGTVTLQNVVVTVHQEYVAIGGKVPLFQPFIEPDTIQISGTNGALQKNLLKNYYILGVLLRQQIAGGGPRVGDIIKTVKLTATNRVIVGDQPMALDDLQEKLARDFAGTTYALGGTNPYLFFYFARDGKLSKVLRPNDPNLKLTLSVANSATAGTSEIAVTYFGLVRDNSVRENGSVITASKADLDASGLTI